MSDIKSLRIELNGVTVGILTLDKTERCEFRLTESYKKTYPQPVLGQVFLDDPDKVHSSRARVPSWFSNLLPEGPLRDFVAKQAGVVSSREFFLLHHLGGDLPGAIRVISNEKISEPKHTSTHKLDETGNEKDLHFSLAGVQLKFSARQEKRGLTIPVSGMGGDWIVKLPDSRYPLVPENELATMQWAKLSGIEIPDIKAINVEDISGIPTSLRSFSEKTAIAIRRFDRPKHGSRIHMEDFAQILGLYPEEKYKKYNYETIAQIIFSIAGVESLKEFILRLIFIITSGNGDAHHKNWSIIYPDGINGKLSPAYDMVSTIQYISDDQLALNFSKSKKWEDITIASFRRLARKLEIEESDVVSWVDEAIESIQNAWNTSEDEHGYSKDARERILQHINKIPLLQRTPSAWN